VSLSQDGVCLSCPGFVDLGILLPHLAGVVVEAVTAAVGLLLVTARARAPESACPGCGTVSDRVHSRYCRTLADAAVGGRPAAIALTVRRFFCADPGCPRKTFAEQVDGLTSRYARKTPLLAGMLVRIAVALAGRAGSRLAAGLGVPASRQVLLRLVMAAPDPAAGEARVLGVDDFAIRRGQHYGTLLINIETGAPLDLLEGRDAKPLADWLAAHPGIEVICRDRGVVRRRRQNRGTGRGPGRRPLPPVAEPRQGRREVRRGPPRLPGRSRAPARRGIAGPGPTRAGTRRAARSDGEVRRAHPPASRACPPAARRRARPARDRPPPRLGPAHRPATRPRRDLAGTRRRTLAGTAPEQTRPVQALPRPARRRRPRQHPPPVPRDQGPRL